MISSTDSIKNNITTHKNKIYKTKYDTRGVHNMFNIRRLELAHSLPFSALIVTVGGGRENIS
jgi:hypothetical protein